MPDLTISSWNIYFSHKLDTGSSENFRLPIAEHSRVQAVASVIQSIDPNLLSIVECMPAWKAGVFSGSIPAGIRSVNRGNQGDVELGPAVLARRRDGGKGGLIGMNL